MRVLLFGDLSGWSGYHVGDEAMAAANLAWVRESVPGARVVLVSGDPEFTARAYGVPSVPEPGPRAGLRDAGRDRSFLRALRDSDVLLLSGGGNLTSLFPEEIRRRTRAARAARRFGIPVVLTGQTLGPRLDPADRRRLARWLPEAASVGVRDAGISPGLADRLGVSRDRLVVAPDDAFLLDPAAPRRRSLARRFEGLEGRAVAGVSFHRTPGCRRPEAEDIARFAAALAPLLTDPQAHLLFLPHERTPGRGSDIRLARAVRRALPDPSRASILKGRLLAPEMLSVVDRCDLVVSTRYHDVVFALSRGVPAIGVAQDDYTREKLRGAFAMAGLPERVHDLDDLLLPGWVGRAWSARRDERGAALRAARRVRVRARQARRRVLRAMPPPGAARARPARDRLVVRVEPPRCAEGSVTRAAVLECPGRPSRRLFYRVPEEWASSLGAGAEAFAVGAVAAAATAGCDLVVRGPVSRDLLANLEELVEAWHAMDRAGFRRVAVSATEEVDSAAPPPPAAIAAFSGGVDASFTLLRHARALAGRRSRPIGAAVLVHGFDIPLEDRSGFRAAYEAARECLRPFGMPLVPVETNWRELEVDWERTYAAAVASVLHLFSGGFGAGLVASGHDYSWSGAWGSTPAADRFLGSREFEIVHDGAGFSRAEKIAALANEPELLRGLRVCWQGADRAGNCGECEKCVRTILAFRAAGHPPPSCFPGDVDLARIRALRFRSVAVLDQFRDVARAAAANGRSGEPWARALARRVARAERIARREADPRRLRRRI